MTKNAMEALASARYEAADPTMTWEIAAIDQRIMFRARAAVDLSILESAGFAVVPMSLPTSAQWDATIAVLRDAEFTP